MEDQAMIANLTVEGDPGRVEVPRGYRLHDLRHTAATMVGAHDSADPKTMQAMLGGICQHPVSERVRQASSGSRGKSSMRSSHSEVPAHAIVSAELRTVVHRSARARDR